jgi:hypothetical protein
MVFVHACGGNIVCIKASCRICMVQFIESEDGTSLLTSADVLMLYSKRHTHRFSRTGERNATVVFIVPAAVIVFMIWARSSGHSCSRRGHGIACAGRR